MYEGKVLGVVVPAYNEEGLIGETLDSVPDYVDKIFLVDDASTDDTSKKAKRYKSSRLKVVSHEVNRGVGAAISTGYRACLEEGCDLVAVMAGDAQMDGTHLQKLLKPLVEGRADYVKGNRLRGVNRHRMPAFRVFGNALLSFLTKICSGYWDVVDPQNGYTATTREVLESLDLKSLYPRYGYPNDLLVKLNVYDFRVLDVAVPAKYDREKSKIRISNYIPTVTWLLIKGFFWRMKEKYVLQSFHPLVFFYMMGLAFLPLGLFTAAYMLYLRLTVGSITAASALIPIFLFTVGIQSLFFAMLFDMESTRR